MKCVWHIRRGPATLAPLPVAAAMPSTNSGRKGFIARILYPVEAFKDIAQ